MAGYGLTRNHPEQIMRVGILDCHRDNVACLERGRHVAQIDRTVDLGCVGLRAAGGADVAILVCLADLVDDDGERAANLRRELGGADPLGHFHDPGVAFFLDRFGHRAGQVIGGGTLDRLEIGGIEARKLKIVISPGLGDTDVLGMNFLSQLQSWRVENRTLILTPERAKPAG